MRKKSEQSELKKMKTYNENKEKKENAKQEMIKQIQLETKEQLLPSLQTKMNDLVNYVVDLVKETGEEINANQIMSLLAKKSLNEIAMSTYQISYTPQEIAIAFNIYLDMVDRINKVTKFPPTIHSFATMLGITAETFNNWLSDPDKREIASYIKTYFVGAINTSTLTKQVDTIAGIYTTKTMGLVEQAQPIIIEHKKEASIDEINRQLSSLKRDKIIEGEWNEKDE